MTDIDIGYWYVNA